MSGIELINDDSDERLQCGDTVDYYKSVFQNLIVC